MPTLTTKLGPLPGIEFICHERRPFIDSIWDSHDDDAPLLIYADWLDEHEKNGGLVRWWVKARREYVPTIEPSRKKAFFSDIEAASENLFALRGQLSCVLATVAVKFWQEKLHQVDWGKIANSDEIRAKIEAAWFAVELAGMRLLPIEVIEAARDSAWAAGNSAWAAGDSAWAARDSAFAAGDSACEKLIRIAVNTFSAKWWKTMPGGE